MSLIWVNGRFAWPFVIVIAYVSASLVVADYMWRVLVMPFDTLLLYTAIADLAVAAALYLLFGKRRARGAGRT